MRKIVIIPARLGSSRFPGKPLAKMVGVPMVGHCYFRAKLAPNINDVYVATCDNEIADYIQSIGGKAEMTSKKHTRASTRTAEALETIEKRDNQKVDVVVMVQGDEPLIPPFAISESLDYFTDPKVEIVNIMSRLRTLKAFKDHNNVKVVVDDNSDALYFSREPIPSPWKGWRDIPRYMQTGIISFRRDVLHHFNSINETSLEQIESIDMNRVLETGGKIRMVLTEAFTIGVDTLEELNQAEKLLLHDPVVKQYIELG